VQIQSIPFAVRGRVCGLGTIGVSNERQPNQPEMNGEQTAEGYSWTQTNDEIEIWVPISATLKPIVTFRQMTLKVSVNNVRVSLELYARVDTDGCMWTLETTNNDKRQKMLVITCEKSECGFIVFIQSIQKVKKKTASNFFDPSKTK